MLRVFWQEFRNLYTKEKQMQFPSIDKVAQALREINSEVEVDTTDPDEDACDVRLQVYDDDGWAVRWGDASYDQDHRGYWGASSVPGNGRRFSSHDIAIELLEQVRDHYAQCH